MALTISPRPWSRKKKIDELSLDVFQASGLDSVFLQVVTDFNHELKFEQNELSTKTDPFFFINISLIAISLVIILLLLVKINSTLLPFLAAVIAIVFGVLNFIRDKIKEADLILLNRIVAGVLSLFLLGLLVFSYLLWRGHFNNVGTKPLLQNKISYREGYSDTIIKSKTSLNYVTLFKYC